MRWKGDLSNALRDCSSGREMMQRGYDGDVALAAELDADAAVPMLIGEGFMNAAASSTSATTRS